MCVNEELLIKNHLWLISILYNLSTFKARLESVKFQAFPHLLHTSSSS